MTRMTGTDRTILHRVWAAGGAHPPRDIPGCRKVYAPVLRSMRRLEAKGWLASDVDEMGADFFTITPAGAEAVGIDL